MGGRSGGGLHLDAAELGRSRDTEFLQFPVFSLLMLWVVPTGVMALTRDDGRGPS